MNYMFCDASNSSCRFCVPKFQVKGEVKRMRRGNAKKIVDLFPSSLHLSLTLIYLQQVTQKIKKALQSN